MLSIWNQFDDLFADNLRTPRSAQASRAFSPAVDIVEDKEGYTLFADVPGLKPEDVGVSIEEGVLSLKGERKTESVDNPDGPRRIERAWGSFRRSFSLPKGVDADAITAKVEQGVLTLRVPKPARVLPRKVEVKAS